MLKTDFENLGPYMQDRSYVENNLFVSHEREREWVWLSLEHVLSGREYTKPSENISFKCSILIISIPFIINGATKVFTLLVD